MVGWDGMGGGMRRRMQDGGDSRLRGNDKEGRDTMGWGGNDGRGAGTSAALLV